MTKDDYSQLIAKRSNELNHLIEDLKKLEAYAVCARDIFDHMQIVMSDQSTELKNLQSNEKITKETHDIAHTVIKNVLRSLKTMQDQSIKDYYLKLGATEFIKNDMTELVNSQAKELDKEKEEIDNAKALKSE